MDSSKGTARADVATQHDGDAQDAQDAGSMSDAADAASMLDTPSAARTAPRSGGGGAGGAHDPGAPPRPGLGGDGGSRNTAGVVAVAAGGRAATAAGSVADDAKGAAGGSTGSSATAGASGSAGQGEVIDRTFAQWPMPEALDGAARKPSYSVQGETVLDNVTMLVWQRRTPQLYEGCRGQYSTDSPAGDACTWDEAKRYCASAALATLLGGSGWRLPTKIELESIMDETKSNPAIDLDAFPDTPSQEYWTSTRFAGMPNYAWPVHFYYGNAAYGDNIGHAYRVRCVR
jgi:hypothetical protein